VFSPDFLHLNTNVNSISCPGSNTSFSNTLVVTFVPSNTQSSVLSSATNSNPSGM